MSDATPQQERLARACSAVLDCDALLSRILGAGALGAAELASAAQVSRRWRRAAGEDVLWRAAWRHEAASLCCAADAADHAEKAAGIAAGTSSGFRYRDALAQLRAATAMARGGAPKGASAWKLRDFTFALDVSWHGAVVFSGTQTADNLCDVFTGDDASTLGFSNELHRAPDPAALADAAETLRDETGLDSLQLRLLVRRADGALACLAAEAVCGGQVDWIDDALFAEWRSDDLPVTGNDLRGMEWALWLDVAVQHEDDDEKESEQDVQAGGAVLPAQLFLSADLRLSWPSEHARGDPHPVLKKQLLQVLASGGLRWVLPTGAGAAAKARTDGDQDMRN